MLIGKRLKDLRKARGLNQQELGDLVNVTKVSICCYEKGTRTPNLETFQDLANVFNVSTDYLLGNDIKAEVSGNEESYILNIPKEAAEFLCELKLNKDLYNKVMGEDPKRIIELLKKLLQ
ncbi:MAG: helix-turn-helix transcriptional regulator [Bacilli bacterium]|nr:helix-turn-helix transcriptional regulator [Bacilli bacterium]MDD3304701.1 helix-turn-helix transcriptional regulator [Bacilli bacterium]MDD4053620.1 helix-turn-helix transcriptional regulator [Bacilli bacterium]MDD4411119.1 helix-turn-helix transcriptional regulator [Bacilli bacterium]